MKRDRNELVDRYRRALVRSGFTLSAGALALESGGSFAEETLVYPSADEILPKEWSRWGECIFTAVVSPYRNSNDLDIRMSGGAAGSWPAIVRDGDRYVATLRIGVLNPHFDHVAPA